MESQQPLLLVYCHFFISMEHSSRPWDEMELETTDQNITSLECETEHPMLYEGNWSPWDGGNSKR